MRHHPYILWRRAALWSNSSWTSMTIFWGGCFTAAWLAGSYTMKLTNKRTYDPALQREVQAKQTTEQSVQTDIARQQLQRLLDDIQRGDEQSRDWKPR